MFKLSLTRLGYFAVGSLQLLICLLELFRPFLNTLFQRIDKTLVFFLLSIRLYERGARDANWQRIIKEGSESKELGQSTAIARPPTRLQVVQIRL